MVTLQITEKPGAHLRQILVKAMRDGDLKTFTAQDRGRKITHVRYPGWMKWTQAHGVILCEIRSPKKPGEEWQLLSAFVGRLAHRFADQVQSIQIQFLE